MKLLRKEPDKHTGYGVSLCLLMLSFCAGSVSAATSTDYAFEPPFIKSSATPKVMLSLSNDEQLFRKAYSDYEDMDLDGEIDTTYDHSQTYRGYFGSSVCYSYDSAASYFSAESLAEPVDTGVDDDEGADILTADNYCSGTGQWHGNFLNWATMTRIDMVRQALYGGKRSTDTAASTVLERAYLPNDGHSFAKYYAGADLSYLTPASVRTTEVTFCNTTPATTGYSQDVTTAPIIRIAKSDERTWAMQGGKQCQENDVAAGDYVGQRVIRVNVCSNTDALEDFCQTYTTDAGDASSKPVGLLQELGDALEFGLFTGSYGKNQSGGVLRKNVGVFDEVNENGTFDSTAAGIVANVDALRIFGYDHASGNYTDVLEGDSCTDGAQADADGTCVNWGNPLSEMLTECYRYFGGDSATADSNFTSDDSTFVSGLTNDVTWTDPLTADTSCAKLAVVAISGDLNSYDHDQISTSLLSAIQSKTDAVGDTEGISDQDYYIGFTGPDNIENGQCSEKNVSDGLSEVQGLCPSGAAMEGGFLGTGSAFRAKTVDLRSDLDGDQLVDTYGISLGGDVPVFTIDVPNKDGYTVHIVPACHSYTRQVAGDGLANCSLLDVQFTETPATVDGETTATVAIAWDRNEKGVDFDRDIFGYLSVSVTAGGVTVTTSGVAADSSDKLGFGYFIYGTDADGFHVPDNAGINSFCDSYACTASTSGAVSFTYSAEPTDINFLQPLLYYAAKFGNFGDTNGNSEPDLQAEWDVRDLDRNPNADGIPDGYFPVSNPTGLKTALSTAFDDLVARASSGTAVAVTLERSDGVGATFQAYYYAEYEDADNKVTWLGGMHALFLDENGNLYEDTVNDGILKTGEDLKVQLKYDASAGRTRVYRTTGIETEVVEVEDLNPLWDARDRLSSLSQSAVTSQRTYTETGGRYIFTWLDDGNGIVEDGEQLGFTSANLITDTESTFRHFGHGGGATGKTKSALTLNFIRGYDTWATGTNMDLPTGMTSADILALGSPRDRTVDFGDGSKTWRLGDILNSSPVVVARPSADFDTKFQDTSYAEYRAHYYNRRQVVYMGANDGMLHAFNAGFYIPGSKQFATQLTTTVDTGEVDGDGNAITADAIVGTAHALGDELWAYVPGNLLPHLRWLEELDYPHVAYVDGEPQVFDVNIFADDDTHINGWGTILVVGFRFGGGDISVDLTGDGTAETTTRSAYVILDVTDPEQPPILIAEITDPNLGYTTSVPALISARQSILTTDENGDADDDFTLDDDAWYLVFGSGPRGTDALSKGTSDQTAKLYTYDLVAESFVDLNADTAGVYHDTGIAASWIGSPTVADWNRNYVDDVVYYGLVRDIPAYTNTDGDVVDPDPIGDPGGQLNRMVLDLDPSANTHWGNAAHSVLFNDSDQPFQGAPVTYRNAITGDLWILAGTGRFLVNDDNLANYDNNYYGLIEPSELSDPNDSTSSLVYSYSNSGADIDIDVLVDTTGILVWEDGTVSNSSGSSLTINSTSVGNFNTLRNVISDAGGWKIDLPSTTDGEKARNYTKSIGIGVGVAFVEYYASLEVCDPEGLSRLVVADARTGTASPSIYFGVDPRTFSGNITGDILEMGTALEKGAASAPSVFRTNDGDVKLIWQSSTAAINITDVFSSNPSSYGRQAWRELPILKD
ncbi:MAG: hypothetical protein V7744_11000 [Pseudomonadales bacterium]